MNRTHGLIKQSLFDEDFRKMHHHRVRVLLFLRASVRRGEVEWRGAGRAVRSTGYVERLAAMASGCLELIRRRGAWREVVFLEQRVVCVRIYEMRVATDHVALCRPAEI